MNDARLVNTSTNHLSERVTRIDALLLEHVQRRLEGEDVSDDELVAAYPELMPELGERLRILSELGDASVANDEQQEAPTTYPQSSTGKLNIRCPHCRHEIRLSSEACIEDITCISCGSRFNLDLPETLHVGCSRRLGHFELVEKVGSGSFGTVWKARDNELDRVVAVKVPRHGRLDTNELEQFLREARAAAQLNHRNIVSVHEIGREGDTVYIVSDLVDGVALSDWLADQTPTFREAAQICLKIAAALEHAHRAGVIHRDLKPQNIMLDVEREPRLLDFGLAHRDVGEITMTVDGRVLGTPAYMSPEQARGHAHEADGRTDVYSLGVILFEMLTGALPFRGNTQMLLNQVLYDEPRHPRSLNDRIPRDLETVCLKAMAKESGRRYQTASAFADDLRRYLNGEPIAARPVGRIERSWRWARRNPARAGFIVACSVSLMALAGVVVGYNYQLNLTKANRDLETALKITQQARKAAERFQYYQHIAAANAAWQEADLRQVDRLLDDCPLTYQHNWEWRYLKRQCHAELFKLGKVTEGLNWTRAVSFSPDGTQLASGRDDGKVEVWDTTTCRVIHTFTGLDDTLRDVAFAPDGNRLAAATLGGKVCVWDVASGITVWDKMAERCVAFSPNGKWLASGARILDAKTGAEIDRIPYDGQVFKVAIDPGGDGVALGGESGVRIWNLTAGRDRFMPLQLSRAQPTRVWSVVFSPDGDRVAAGGDLGILAIWDAKTGHQLAAPFAAHEGRIWGLRFSPEGTQLATASWDWTVKLWDPQNGELLSTIKRSPTLYPVDAGRALSDVAYSPDGRLLAISGQDGLVQFSETTDPEARILRGHTAAGHCVAISPNASHIVSGGFHTVAPSMESSEGNNNVRIWDGLTCQLICELSDHVDAVRTISLSPDGRLVASAGDDGKVVISDLKSGRQQLRINCPQPVYGVSFSPNGDQIAAACQDGIRVWKSTTGDLTLPVLEDKRHRDGIITCVVFSDDGGRIASGNQWMVGVWDATTGRLIHPLLPNNDQGFKFVFDVEFSGDKVIAATRPCIRIWDTNTGQPVLSSVTGHRGTFRGAAVSQDGGRLASIGADQTLRLWDMATGNPLLVLRGHTDEVLDVNFSKDGNWLVSTSLDGTIRLWDARPLTPECSTRREAVSALEFLLTKPLSESDAIAYLKTCAAIRPEARRIALDLVDRYREETDPEHFFGAAWGIVRRPHLNDFQYRLAHKQAITAFQLEPSRIKYRVALAMAQYRLAQEQQARITLTHVRAAMNNLNQYDDEDIDCLRAATGLIEGQL